MIRMTQRDPAPLRRHQFSLASLFMAVAFIGLGCTAMKYFVAIGSDPHSNSTAGLILPFLGIPISICGAVGAFDAQIKRWLLCGVMIDVFIVTMILIQVVARQ